MTLTPAATSDTAKQIFVTAILIKVGHACFWGVLIASRVTYSIIVRVRLIPELEQSRPAC